MNILGVIFCVENNHRWYEALAISYGEDQSSTKEGGYISRLGFPNAFPRGAFLGTDNFEP